jgi:multiple sugar transport system substrate-binding protein
MNKKQLLLALTLLVTAGLILVACGGAAPTVAPTQPPAPTQAPPPTQAPAPTQPPAPTQALAPTQPPAAQVKLTVWGFGTEEEQTTDGHKRGDWFRAKAKEFMQANPNVTIDFAMKGYESGGTTLFVDTALAAGAPPDIYEDVQFRVSKYAAKDLMEDLTPALSAADRADYPPAILKQVTGKDGHLWGFPIMTGFNAFAINKTAFADAGKLDLLPKEPNRDWTTDEFVAALKAVNKPPTIYGTFFFAKTPSFDYTFNNYAFGFGAEFYKGGDYTKCTINSPEGVKWFEWVASIVKQKLAVPGGAGLVDDDQDSYWSRKAIGMTGAGFYYRDLAKTFVDKGQAKAPYEVYIVNYPHDAGQPPPPMGIFAYHVWSIFKQSDAAKRDAAFKYINFMNQPENHAAIAKGYGRNGTRISQSNLYPDDPDQKWAAEAAKRNGIADFGFSIPHFNEIRLKWAETRQALLSGDKTAKQALDDYVNDCNSLITSPP